MATRLARYAWADVEQHLDDQGWSLLPKLLPGKVCQSLAHGYDRDELYRSTVDMARHQFGKGQYRYFQYPLPRIIDALRHDLYARLAPLANAWAGRLHATFRYPPRLDGFLQRCHRDGQTRPTPLVLRYHAGDYNRLHQDLYGPLNFPLQVLVVLSQHGSDYDGGEVIFVEQQPRAQSKAVALQPDRGDAIIFTNRERPVRGSRGFYRVQMRHGASEVRRGERFVLGIIFHDAA